MTTALFTLRALQIGLHMADLECFTYGEVLDMMTESGNDQHQYNYVATKEDIAKF